MRYIDITKTISNKMKGYATDPIVKIKGFKSLKKGNSCNLSEMSLGTHAGTHIDAPRHIINKAATVDKIDINDLICKVAVVSIDRMRRKDFCNSVKGKGIKGILLKKGPSMAKLRLEDAKFLVKNQLKLIGTEEMSVEVSGNKKHPVHRLLLAKGVIIIESLDLKEAKQGYYKLICLPLKIKSGDGAPARAILLDD